MSAQRVEALSGPSATQVAAGQAEVKPMGRLRQWLLDGARILVDVEAVKGWGTTLTSAGANAPETLGSAPAHRDVA